VYNLNNINQTYSLDAGLSRRKPGFDSPWGHFKFNHLDTLPIN